MKRFIKPILLVSFCTALVFAVHYFFPSMINDFQPGFGLSRLENTFGESAWKYHRTLPAFAGRMVTYTLVGLGHNFTGLNYSVIFTAINFAALWACGLVLFLLAHQLGQKEKDALVSVVWFYLGYTILFAFFHSIETYDEPLQYLFILLAGWLALKKQWAGYVVFLILALLARETTVLIFPALVYIFRQGSEGIKDIKFWKKIGLTFLASGIFLAVWSWWMRRRQLTGQLIDYTAHSRFEHLQFNFQDSQYAIESVVSALIVICPSAFLLWQYSKTQNIGRYEKIAAVAFLITLVINTPIVLLVTRAREARLFALPLLFLWPFLGKYILTVVKQIRLNNFLRWANLPKLLVVALVGILIAYFSLVWFKPTFTRGFDWGFQIYVMMVGWAMSLTWFGLKISTNKNSPE